MNADIQRLKDIAGGFSDDKVVEIANYLLDDEDFQICSGSSKPFQHHYGDGGLARHTLEVVELCQYNHDLFLKNRWGKNISDGEGIDELELFFAALFHDAGKMYDYERIPETQTIITKELDSYNLTSAPNQWTSAPHKRLIHHISRSSIIWSEACSKFGDIEFDNLGRQNLMSNIYGRYHDKVLHAILAHHGRREYGSPVAPLTRVAWMVHICDQMSARMNDADTLDVTKGEIM